MTRAHEVGNVGGGAAGARSFAGPLLLAVGVVAAISVFWSGLAHLVAAWSTPEYSHGPLIPMISTFLFLRELRHAPPTDAPIRDRWPGVALCVLALLVGALGSLANIPNIVTYAFIAWVAGVILIGFGLRRGAVFWPAVVHLSFMLPLPQFIYWEVSTYLQLVSSEIGVWLIRLFAIPVYLDGNIIDLGVYKLQVAEACSGLRYLFPMLSFSFVFAVLYQGPVWHKLLLLLAAAPITVLMNSLRVGMIGILVNSYGIEQAEGFLHVFEGWVIFMSCIGILFLLATLLQQTTANPQPLSQTLDISFEGMGAQARRVFDVAFSPALAVAVALTVGALAAWTLAPERQLTRVERQPLALFPNQIDMWRGRRDGRLEPNIERVLGADDYFSARFVNDASTAPVSLFMAYYHDQNSGTGIHSPEICLPGGGWEVSGWDRSGVTLPSGEQLDLVRAVIQKGQSRQLVYFWFDLRGRKVSGAYEAKFLNVIDSALRGRSDGTLVRLTTPMDRLEDRADAEARIERFIEALLPVLPRYAPE